MRFRLTLTLLAIALVSARNVPAADAVAEPGIAAGMREASKPLLKALSLVGTPYRFGGRKPENGLDCSGLVSHVYKQSEQVELPHNAREISQKGQPVAREDLKPGDLVFFNTLRKPFSHVGIYKGDGKFVHASSSRSRQVMVSDMRERYWAERFDGARRITRPD